MSLSCSCDYEYDFDPGDWYYCFEKAEYLIQLATARRKRCCSCKQLINIGATCNIYPRVRYPYTEAESRICINRDLEDALCDEATIPMVPHYHCEKCAEIFLNLTDIGYECILPNEDMRKLLKEYRVWSGFKK